MIRIVKKGDPSYLANTVEAVKFCSTTLSVIITILKQLEQIRASAKISSSQLLGIHLQTTTIRINF
jgi:hypothetical protein